MYLASVGPASAQAPPPSPPAQPAPTTKTPTAQGGGEYRSTKLVGTHVYNGANEDIGVIDDLVLDEKGAVTAVVVGVGGSSASAIKTSPCLVRQHEGISQGYAGVYV